MVIETTPFDAAEYLGDPESQAELISDAFESGDPHYIAHALGIIARARGMTQLAKDSGVTREALYKALSKDGDPRLSTFTSVLSALGGFVAQMGLRPDFALPQTDSAHSDSFGDAKSGVAV